MRNSNLMKCVEKICSFHITDSRIGMDTAEAPFPCNRSHLTGKTAELPPCWISEALRAAVDKFAGCLVSG